MLTSPTVHVSLRRFGAWRGAVAVLTALGLASQAAWALARQANVGAAALAVGVCVAVTMLLVCASLLRSLPVGLHWDGRAWHLGPEGADGVEGRVAVMLDLGPWMLLRFEPLAASGRRHAVWLPVQRRGLEAQWHALRCAVYSPRAHPAAAGPDGV